MKMNSVYRAEGMRKQNRWLLPAAPIVQRTWWDTLHTVAETLAMAVVGSLAICVFLLVA